MLSQVPYFSRDERRKILPSVTLKEALTNARGTFDPWDTQTCQPCTLEGIVSRNHDAFSVADFSHNVFKYVRKNHVKTTVHWKRHWQRARMAHEFVYGEQS